MKSILIEGTESSGKTTIVKEVKNELSKKGFKVISNSGPINLESSLVYFPLNIAEKIKNPSLKEIFYTISLLADGFSENNNLSDFFLQDRFYPSVMAYSLALNKRGINKFVGNFLKKNYQKFEHNILLTLDKESFIQRMSKRERKTSLDLLFEKNPDKALEVESYMRKILSEEEKYLEIDTSKLNIESCKNKILEKIL
jgi:thymidylate kinase